MVNLSYSTLYQIIQNMYLKLQSLILFIAVSLLLSGFTPEPDRIGRLIQSDPENTWDLKKEANGIQIYTRDYPDSPVKEFLAITTTNSSLQSVTSVLDDISAYPKWFRNCKYVKTIRRASDSAIANYVEISFPWPLSNRDGIWEATIRIRNESVYYSEIRSIPDLVPEKKNIVRMHNACGYWKVEKMKNGKTKITQQFFADPEGNIPGWVVNLFLVDGPYDTFMNLHKILNDED